MDILVFQLLLVLSILVFVLPKSVKVYFTIGVVLTFSFITSIWTIEVLQTGVTITRYFAFEFWDRQPMLEIDRLSAVFLLIINLTAITGVIYSIGYLKPYLDSKSSISFSIHYLSYIWLHASMLQVVMLQAGLEFLLVWELMALSSFFVVIFDSEKPGVLATGINYLVQMHIGFGFLLMAFLVVDFKTGEMSFVSLNTYFSQHNNFPLFLLFFIGFGIKAGFVPLHSWLPRAHPAAPTHISAFMSAVIIKMGIYGIFRVVTYLQTDFFEIGLLVLLVSMCSGIFGVMMAIFQHDLKKLLAYHSIENIGIIGIGLGTGILGKHFDNPALTMLGFGGSLLHVLNHSLFKSSLFYSAGNVYQASNTKNIEKLGGVIHQMPWTAFVFLLSALAICGIPPFNGFISEFLIYSGVFKNLTHADFTNSVISIASIMSLALIGGLALFCFTKAFGVAFLGVKRSNASEGCKERQWSMLIPGIVPIVLMIVIGFWPLPFFEIIRSTFSSFAYIEFYGTSNEPIHVTLSQITKGNLIFISLTFILLLIRSRHMRKHVVTNGPTWGCGYTMGDYKHQYTSTSFANNLRELARPFILYKKVTNKIERSELFPESRDSITMIDDKIEMKVLLPPINWMKNILPKAGLAQTGHIHHYLLYPVLFMISIALLSYFDLL